MHNKIFSIILGISFGIFVFLAVNIPLKWVALIFLALAFFFTSIIIQNRKKFFLTLMIVDMDLLINTHIFDDPDVLLSIVGLQISVTTIALGVLYLLWWGEIITKRSKRIEIFPKTTIFIFGYMFSCLLSLFNSSSIPASFFEIFFFLQMFLMYLYIANYIKDKEDIIYILQVLLLCLFIQSATILIQYVTGIEFNFTGKKSDLYVFEYFREGRSMETYRPAGTGGAINAAGAHISMLLLMMLSLLFYTKNRFKNILVWFVLLMGIAALILTFSRNSWIGFAVGLVVFLFVALRHRWISGKKVVSMAVLIAVILSVFSVPMAARLSQDDKGSAWARVPLMKLAFNMIQEHPFIGVGVNNFGIVLLQYASSELQGEWLHIVHNQYLLVFAETGAIGVVFFLLIMATVIHTCLGCVKYNDPLLSLLSISILSGIATLSLFMMYDLSSTSRLTAQLFWIMVSIVIGSEKLIRINRQEFLNLPTPAKVEALTSDRGFIRVHHDLNHGSP
jgi:putative inorganic carbon (hco3(-)) transporter